MKKIVSTFVLLIVLSFTVFADDGTTHTGGKTCPEGQTSCFAGPVTPAEPAAKPLYKGLLDYLKNLFG